MTSKTKKETDMPNLVINPLLLYAGILLPVSLENAYLLNLAKMNKPAAITVIQSNTCNMVTSNPEIVNSTFSISG